MRNNPMLTTKEPTLYMKTQVQNKKMEEYIQNTNPSGADVTLLH